MSNMELVDKILTAAEKRGVKEVEAVIVARRAIGVEIERAEIKTCNDSIDNGLGVRSITDHKSGFAFTNMLTPRSVENTVKRAVEASRACPKDVQWKQLPERRSYPIVRDVYDRKITEFTSDQAVRLCQTMITTAQEVDKRVLPAFGGSQVTIFEVTCCNNRGIKMTDQGTSLTCSLATMARTATHVSPMCFEFQASRRYEPDPEWVAREAAKVAIDAINIGPAESGKFPILLDAFALQSILTYTFIQSIKADIVTRGRSIYRGKLGTTVAGTNITIHDNGILAGGLYSGRMDMEGVPQQETPVIEEGVLSGFLYDNYWARREGRQSTGNASRGGGGLDLPSYGTIPAIRPTNIQFKAGSFTHEELLEEVQTGYYVRNVQGAHQSNPETGDFSVAATPAWKIHKGKLTHAVKGVMIAGNGFDLLKKIVALGQDSRQVGTFIAPQVVISELNVITP